MSKPTILIDTDLNYPSDDFQALFLLLTSTQFNIAGISAAPGNTFAEEVFFNIKEALRILERQDIPVVPGNEAVFDPEVLDVIEKQHDAGLLSFCGSLEKASAARVTTELREKYSQEQHQSLSDLLLAIPGQVTLLCLGALTNIARVFSESPHLYSKIDRIVLMGGALNEGSHHKVEFNFWYDPEAASAVLDLGIPTLIFPYETTRLCRASKEINEFVGQADGYLWETFAADYQGMLKQHGAEMPLCDQLVALSLMDPSIVSQTRRGMLELNTSRSVSYGTSVFKSSDDAHVEVVTEIDMSRVRDCLMQHLSKLPRDIKELGAPIPVESYFLCAG